MTRTGRYDDAHRLISVRDGLLNTISYTLNAAGDIIETQQKDASGVLKFKSSTVFDTLGRISQELGNNGQFTRYTYNDNDNTLSSTIDALNSRP